jgi:LysR family hydrogen peroxide-inducible transcriptional activator
MNTPTLRHLRFFVALAEIQNFSLAAQDCYVTQPTLSTAIKEMEAILGHKLFNRGKRKVTLTAMGAEFLPAAKDIVNRAESMMERAQYAKGAMAGPLRLGIIPTIAPYMLPQILPVIQRVYPNLELQIFEDMSHRLVEELNLGALDVILMAFPYETPRATQMILFEEPFYLAAPKSRAPHAKKVDANALEPGELLLLADGHCMTDHALAACNLQPATQRKAYSASSLTTLIQMVASGYGMTLLPEMAVNQSQLPDTIEILPFKDPRPTRKIGLAWHSGSAREGDYLKLAEIIKGKGFKYPAPQPAYQPHTAHGHDNSGHDLRNRKEQSPSLSG